MRIYRTEGQFRKAKSRNTAGGRVPDARSPNISGDCTNRCGALKCVMAPKHHPAPLSGGDRKALTKELAKSRAMTHIFAERSAEKRREGEALIREADNLAC